MVMIKNYYEPVCDDDNDDDFLINMIEMRIDRIIPLQFLLFLHQLRI